jgi:hypothetical protein
VCTGTVPSGDTGGNRPSLPSQGAQVCQPSVPSPEMGFPKRETYDSMGAKGQVSPCGQTPDGGYSVREPAARAWGDRLGLVTRSASQERA